MASPFNPVSLAVKIVLGLLERSKSLPQNYRTTVLLLHARMYLAARWAVESLLVQQRRQYVFAVGNRRAFIAPVISQAPIEDQAQVLCTSSPTSTVHPLPIAHGPS